MILRESGYVMQTQGNFSSQQQQQQQQQQSASGQPSSGKWSSYFKVRKHPYELHEDMWATFHPDGRITGWIANYFGVESFTGTWKPDGTFTYKETATGAWPTVTIKSGTSLEATCGSPDGNGGTHTATFQYAMTPAEMDKAAADAKDRLHEHQAREFKKAVDVAACLGCSIS